MPSFLTSEPMETVLAALVEALDIVDFGIVLLNKDLELRFINRRFVEIWALPEDLLVQGATFRQVMDYVGRGSRYDIAPAELADYIDQREAAIRAGPIAPIAIDLTDGRRLQFCCLAPTDSSRILTYADITRMKREQELQRHARDAAEQIGHELRFSNETLESQAAYLASLAETADEAARNAERAKRQLEREVEERAKLEKQLRLMATTDALTGALNRAQVITLGQREMERVRTADQDLAVLMIDIDHFKAINDRYGHPAGDAALKHLAARLAAGVRRIDLVGRIGGEEFLVVLPAITPTTALLAAERLRKLVADGPLDHDGHSIAMTISIGVALARGTDRTVEQVLARADTALYAAKRNGRNRIESTDDIATAAA